MSVGKRPSAGISGLQLWSRRERLLGVLLLALAASAWLLAHLLAAPDMRAGILTGAHMGGDMTQPTLWEAALFLMTWMVMMAAMMLPSLVPFTVGISRLMRTGGAGAVGTVLVTFGYFVIWSATGVAAYLVWSGFQTISAGSTTSAVHAGAAVLAVAAVYQLTPLKRICLRYCRSPGLLLLQHGPRAASSRSGALRAGLAHGGYCLGCCWALMGVLLALGVMSLVWMAVVAAVIALEKVSRYGLVISRGLGVLLAGLAGLVEIEPMVVHTMG